VGNPVAVNAQKKLKKVAASKGWPLLSWHTPAGYSKASRAEVLTFDTDAMARKIEQPDGE
jgi:hypothetical protein